MLHKEIFIGGFLLILIVFVLWFFIWKNYSTYFDHNRNSEESSAISSSGSNELTGNIEEQPGVILSDDVWDIVFEQPNFKIDFWLKSFLNSDQKYIDDMMSRDMLNIHIFPVQKVINDRENNYSEEYKQELKSFFPTFFWMVYDFILVNPEKYKLQPISKENFVDYMVNMVITWEAEGDNVDISEVIAGNKGYCTSATDKFPTEQQQQNCLAQMEFYHSKNLTDCEVINGDIAPEWKELCINYYSSKE